MPKLDNKAVKEVEAAEEWASRELLPSGNYLAKLDEVKVGQGKKGPYWTWVLEVQSDVDGETDHAGRKLFHITSLSEKARGGLKQTFNAFGFTPDSDTDEIIGSWVEVVVGAGVIKEGERQGEKTNRVLGLIAYDDGESPAGSADDLG